MVKISHNSLHNLVSVDQLKMEEISVISAQVKCNKLLKMLLLLFNQVNLVI